MSSTSTTQYYGLTQYVGTDKPSFLDNNEAFASIDADLHGAVTDVASQGETISTLSETVNGLDGDVTNLSNDLDTEKGKIVALQDKEVLQDGAIAAVKADALDMICAYNEEAATSTHAYAIGDYFRYNDVLYKATSAIAIGDTIVPNVNCEATNVSAELLEIISDIPSGAVAASDVTYDNTSSGLTADDAQEAIDELKSDLGKKVDYLSNSNYTELNTSVPYNSSYVAPVSATYLINMGGDLSGSPKLYLDSARTKEIADYYADSNTYHTTIEIPLKQGTTIYTRNSSTTTYVVKGYYVG